MNDEWLHGAMTVLADEYGPSTSDLHARALRTARRATTRRAGVALAVVAVAASVGAVTLMRGGIATTPLPGTTTSTPAPSTTARADLSRKGTTVDVPTGASDLANATITLPPPAPGWFERPFGRVGLDQFAVDLHTPAPAPVRKWLEAPLGRVVSPMAAQAPPWPAAPWPSGST